MQCLHTGEEKLVGHTQHDLIACENKRIAYVAISRAAQLLKITAPQTSAQPWRDLL